MFTYCTLPYLTSPETDSPYTWKFVSFGHLPHPSPSSSCPWCLLSVSVNQGFKLYLLLFLAVLQCWWQHSGFSNDGERGLPSSCCAQTPHCRGFSHCRAWAQGHVGSAAAAPGLSSTGSAAVAHRLGCSVVCGIFPDQGLNPCPLHWQADSLPLSHQRSPKYVFFFFFQIPHKWDHTCLFISDLFH